MQIKRSVLLPTLLLALLAACDRAADAGETRTAEPPRAAAGPAAGSGDADLDEITDYRLTMDAVRRYYQAQRNVYQAMRDDPGLAKRMDRGTTDAAEFSLDEMEARYEEVPEVREAIAAAGLDTRDFSVITLTLFQSAFAQGAVEMGASRDSILARMGINPSNLDFVRANKTELERMQNEMEALQSGGAIGEENSEDSESRDHE